MVANPEEPENERFFMESNPKYRDNKIRDAFIKDGPNLIWQNSNGPQGSNPWNERRD